MENQASRSRLCPTPLAVVRRSSLEELEEYPTSFRASHLYRIGLHLFKTTDFRCRRRLLIAAPSNTSTFDFSKRLPKDRTRPTVANFKSKLNIR